MCRRVTTAEMLVGPYYVLFFDEISTGAPRSSIDLRASETLAVTAAIVLPSESVCCVCCRTGQRVNAVHCPHAKTGGQGVQHDDRGIAAATRTGGL